MNQTQKSNSNTNKMVPSKREHEIEWRNSWLITWLAASILIPVIVRVMNQADGIFKWALVIALTALAGSLGLYGLLNLILLLQKRC